MATTRCWLKSEVTAMFKELGGKKNIAKLAKMSSAEREALFTKYSDAEAGKDFNLEFEKMLIIPKQQKALENWLAKRPGKAESDYLAEKRGKRLGKLAEEATAKDTEGVLIRQPPARDFISRINKMEQVLNPTKDIAFLESLAKQRLGFEITQADSAEVFSAAKKVNDNKTKMMDLLNSDQKGKDYLDPLKEVDISELSAEQQKAIDDYAQSVVDFQNTYDEIYLKTRTEGFIEKLSGLLKSLWASVDVSGLGRQGLPSTINLLFGKEWKSVKEQNKLSELLTRDPTAVLKKIYSRPNFINGNYEKAGIGIGIREEAYPSAFLEKLEQGEYAETLNKSALGKMVQKLFGGKFSIFTRSANAYNLGIQLGRANYYDMLYKQTNGDRNIFSGENHKRVGALVNTITGRGKATKDPDINRKLNALFFSLRFFTARAEIGATPFISAYKLAMGKFDEIDKLRLGSGAKFLGSVYALSFLINLAVHGLAGDDPDWWRNFFDPLSADFGKLRVGNTHFDLSIGIFSMYSLLARVLSGTTKTQSGAYQKANTGSLLWNYVKPKAAPFFSVLMDIEAGISSAIKGEPLPKEFGTTIFSPGWFVEKVLPMSIMNLAELGYDWATNDDMTTGMIVTQGVGVLADAFGITASTYENKAYDGYDSGQYIYLRDLVAKTGEEPPYMTLTNNTNIMKKLSGEEQERAVAEFQLRWSKELYRHIGNYNFVKKPAKEQMKELKKARNKVLEQINKKYRVSK